MECDPYIQGQSRSARKEDVCCGDWLGLVSTNLDQGASTAMSHSGKGSAELPVLPGRVNAVVQDRVDGGDVGRGSIGETFD